jgi:hypothetical protein
MNINILAPEYPGYGIYNKWKVGSDDKNLNYEYKKI